MSDLISVVVTSYNVGQFLRQCVDSVIRQTYQNIEVLIVDDGSTDDTEKIAKQYVENNKSVRYFYQENAGVSVARNCGIENASGQYIMFVDGDDYLDERIVEELAGRIEDSDIVCCCCKAFTEDEMHEDHFFSSSFTAKTSEEKEKFYLQLLNGNLGKPNGKGYTAIGVPWGKLYRLDFLKNNQLLFDPKLKRMQDNMFNMYAFYCARQIKYIDSSLYYYRLDHIQNKKIVYSENIWLQLLKARQEFFDHFPQVCTDAVMSARFYEENVAVYSITTGITKTNKTFEAMRKMSQVRKYDVFNATFLNERKSRTPFCMTLFRTLMKYRLYFAVAIGLKAAILIRR